MLLHAEWYRDTQGIMGTEVSVSLWADDPTQGQRAIQSIMTEMRRINAALSPYLENSELSKVNRDAAKRAVKISDELSHLIKQSLHYSRLSNGAFDITFASLAQFYDYRQGGKPSAEQIKTNLPAINYQLLALDTEKHTLKYSDERIKIDLGGIAKGYAVDRGVALLKQQGIKHASVSAGGDSRLLGSRRDREWLIGIKHPRQTDGGKEVAIHLPLSDTALSTSGDYERYFIDQATGERIHHIVNPRTGKSASEVMSVTILGENGIDTDPLSTTVFVMGVNSGLALVNRLEGFDAIIIDAKGTVHYSDGLMAAN